MMNHTQLLERLIDFFAQTQSLLRSFGSNMEINYLREQIFRAVGSAAFNYSESRSAESKRDFVHKCSISLKELREAYTGLRMLERIYGGNAKLNQLLKENNELISIFVKTIKTCQSRY